MKNRSGKSKETSGERERETERNSTHLWLWCDVCDRKKPDGEEDKMFQVSKQHRESLADCSVTVRNLDDGQFKKKGCTV